MQEEASGRMQEKQPVSEMKNNESVVSGSRAAAKSDRSERKSVLGALRRRRNRSEQRMAAGRNTSRKHKIVPTTGMTSASD